MGEWAIARQAHAALVICFIGQTLFSWDEPDHNRTFPIGSDLDVTKHGSQSYYLQVRIYIKVRLQDNL